MNTYRWVYALGVVLLAVGLPIFSYLALIYRELGRMNTGRVHEHLEIFEAEIEPKLRVKRRSGGRTFRILGHFWLAFLVLETTRGEFLGDIAISPKVARRNAKSLGRQLPEELKVLILHGVLHLLGYDHETDRGEMERIEMRLRRKLGIA